MRCDVDICTCSMPIPRLVCFSYDIVLASFTFHCCIVVTVMVIVSLLLHMDIQQSSWVSVEHWSRSRYFQPSVVDLISV